MLKPGYILLNADLARERVDSHPRKLVGQCWEWQGPNRHKFGYGQLRIKGRQYSAHQVAYIAWNGPIPLGMQVRHTCDNPLCINPRHLLLGTSQDNHDDMVARGRALTGERNPASKLSDEDVGQIVSLVLQGATQTDVAKAFNISQPQVSRIMRGKSRR